MSKFDDIGEIMEHDGLFGCMKFCEHIRIFLLCFFQLYTNCRLVERVISAWEENASDETRPGFHRKGYMGHLTKIANIMVSKTLFSHSHFTIFKVFP